MSRPRKGDLAHHWTLDPETSFLNHGSFGATPTAILEEQSRLRALIEREPVRFIERDYLNLWDEARSALSEFLNADPEGMTFVSNATAGVNTILRSLNLTEGDEIIVPDHSYQACWNAVDFATERAGAKTVVVELPFRIEDDQEVIDTILGAVTDRTVLALIDTVTSPTGMRMPFEELVGQLQSKGIDVLLDAAHGPGIVPLDLTGLDAAYCTGNCHKWLCTPKGSALLFVRRDRQEPIRPLSISHGANAERSDRSRFRLEFDFTGTNDFTAWMCVPNAIEFLHSLLPGGFEELRANNHDLALAGRQQLCDVLGTEPPAPDDMIGSLASVILPASSQPVLHPTGSDPMQASLWEQYRIEVPVMRWPHPERRMLRISPQIYNSIEQYDYLAQAVRTLV